MEPTMREEEFRNRLRRAIGEPPPLVEPNLSQPERSLTGAPSWLAGTAATVIAGAIAIALIASHGGSLLPLVPDPGRAGLGSVHPSVDRPTLEARPLALQPLDAGQQCPTGEPVRLAIRTSSGKWPNYGFGRRPVYLSGQTTFYAGGDQVIVLLTDPTYTGPVLVRSSRLDGVGSLTFRELDAATGAPEAWLPKTSSPPNWGAWESMMSAPSQGCYGLQFDGENFTEVVVIKLLPGPPPG